MPLRFKNQEYLFSDLGAALEFFDFEVGLKIMQDHNFTYLYASNDKIVVNTLEKGKKIFIASESKSVDQPPIEMKTLFKNESLKVLGQRIKTLTDMKSDYTSLANFFSVLEGVKIFYAPELRLPWQCSDAIKVGDVYLFPKEVSLDIAGYTCEREFIVYQVRG